jgi:site-specific DNA-methyltransferase (adenine-specific)
MTHRIEQLSDDVVLHLGDCRDILPMLGKVDAVVTDPPYGVNLTAKVTKHSKITASHNYADTPEHVLPMVTEAIGLAMTLAPCVLVTPGNRLLQDYPKATSIGTIFAANGAGRDSWGFTGNNPILYFGACPYLKKGLGSRPNSFYSAHPGMHVTGENVTDHPCPKPLAWMLWLVKRASTIEGETILDPFMGSGTTGVACVQLGRKFIGIELDPSYFDIACRRISDELKRPRLDLGEPVAKPVQEALI